MSNLIVCQECSGLGLIVDEEGREHSCPVCDGDKNITFEMVKEYARQIDQLLKDKLEQAGELHRADAEIRMLERQVQDLRNMVGLLAEALRDAQRELAGLDGYLSSCDRPVILENWNTMIVSIRKRADKAKAALEKAGLL